MFCKSFFFYDKHRDYDRLLRFVVHKHFESAFRTIKSIILFANRWLFDASVNEEKKSDSIYITFKKMELMSGILHDPFLAEKKTVKYGRLKLQYTLCFLFLAFNFLSFILFLHFLSSIKIDELGKRQEIRFNKVKKREKGKRYKARNQKQRAYYIKPFDEAKSLFLMIHSTWN